MKLTVEESLQGVKIILFSVLMSCFFLLFYGSLFTSELYDISYSLVLDSLVVMMDSCRASGGV